MKQTEKHYRQGLGNKWVDPEIRNARIQLLQEGQALPLSVKIGKAQELLEQVLNDHGAENVYLAFSGGRDSAVIAHMLEKQAPAVTFVFQNTHLEFRETLEYIRWWEDTYNRKIIRIKPLKSFKWVLKNHGYPFFSKRLSDLIRRAQHGSVKARISVEKLGYAWAIDAGVPISDKCCYYLKHGSAPELEKKFTACILGTTAAESRTRRRHWISFGCYFPVEKGTDRVLPLSFWNTRDVIEYHELTGLPWAKLYDMGFTRNGCRLCGFGSHIARPNKFELLARHFPVFWKKAMEKLGFYYACQLLGIPDGASLFTPKLENARTVDEVINLAISD